MTAFAPERYVSLDGPIHRLDARVKVALLAVFAACVVAAPRGRLEALGIYLGIGVGLTLLARVPPTVILRRAAIMLPVFAGVALVSMLFRTETSASTVPAWLPPLDLMLRLLAILLGGLLLAATTPLWRVSHALRALGAPALIALLFSFVARYAFLLLERVMALHRALLGRGGLPKRLGPRARMLTSASTALLLRAYERAEQVAIAMEARGWDGRMRSLPLPRLGGKAILGGVVAALLLALPCAWAWLR